MKMALLVVLIMFFTKVNAKENDVMPMQKAAHAARAAAKAKDNDEVKDNEFKECLGIKSFQYEEKDGKLSAQCTPSKSSGAFYTDDKRHVMPMNKADAVQRTRWECLDTKSEWPDKEEVEQKTKKGNKQGFVGICKFHSSESKPKKEDVEVCTNNPVHCAPGPKVNWGACVSKKRTDHGVRSQDWKCIPQEEEKAGDTDGYVKGDCSTLRVSDTKGKELYHSVCRFPTEKDAAYPKAVKCPEEWSRKLLHGPFFASVCFSTEDHFYPSGVALDPTAAITQSSGHLLGSYRKEGDQESDPCEWTLIEKTSPTHGFYEGECLLPKHKGYAAAREWSTAKPPPADKPTPAKPAPVKPAPAPADKPASVKPAPVKPAPEKPADDAAPVKPTPVKPAPIETENGGVGTGWIVFLIFLMLAAGGGAFLFCQRANKTGPRELSGGLAGVSMSLNP